MKKLKLKNLSVIGNVLTSEELKHVYGGTGSEGTYRCLLACPPGGNVTHVAILCTSEEACRYGSGYVYCAGSPEVTSTCE